jgi:hypothetical protein
MRRNSASARGVSPTLRRPKAIARVGQAERRGVAVVVARHGARVRPPRALHARDLEHARREVEAHDAAGLRLREELGQVARAAGDVHDVITRPNARKPHRGATPALVESERVQPVVQVIRVGDGGEHRTHLLGLVIPTVRVLCEFILLPDGFRHGVEYRDPPRTHPCSGTFRRDDRRPRHAPVDAPR